MTARLRRAVVGLLAFADDAALVAGFGLLGAGLGEFHQALIPITWGLGLILVAFGSVRKA